MFCKKEWEDFDFIAVLWRKKRVQCNAKTQLAWHKLCGHEGARKDVDEALEERKDKK